MPPDFVAGYGGIFARAVRRKRLSGQKFGVFASQITVVIQRYYVASTCAGRRVEASWSVQLPRQARGLGQPETGVVSRPRRSRAPRV